MSLFDTILEGNPLNDFGQSMGTIQFAPFSFCRHHQFERHYQRYFSAQTGFGFLGAVTNICEDALDWIGGSNVFPMLRWEVIEAEQNVAIPGQFSNGLFIFHTIGFNEEIEGRD